MSAVTDSILAAETARIKAKVGDDWGTMVDRLLTSEAPPLELSNGHYLWTLTDLVEFELAHLNWQKHELLCYLTVTLKGIHPGARYHGLGKIYGGNYNLCSLSTREKLARYLARQSQTQPSNPDWLLVLEVLSDRIMRAFSHAGDLVDLMGVEVTEDNTEREVIAGMRLLKHHPAILFGDGGSAKSLLALYCAGRMVQLGKRVLYLDWELDRHAQRRRWEQVVGPVQPGQIFWMQCSQPLVVTVDMLRQEVVTKQIDYLVLDSVAMACRGPAEESNTAVEFFQSLRQLGRGSLSIAHVNKGEFADEKPFGSSFWHHYARLTYHVKADTLPDKSIRLIMKHRKDNFGPKDQPYALRVAFEPGRTRLEHTAMPVEEGGTLSQRMLPLLATGAMSSKAIADALGARLNSVQHALKANPRIVPINGNKTKLYGISTDGV